MYNPLADIPVLILCGGLGTRLRAVISDRPKALAPIGERPFLDIQMELLRAQGATHFVLCVGHRAEQVKACFGDGSSDGVRIDYSEEGENLLGTAGALRLAERFFTPRALVLNGDTYLDVDYSDVVRHHLSSPGAEATLTLARSADSRRFGTVELDEPTGRILGFREKDPLGEARSGWLNAGAYVIERSLIETIPAGVPVSIERQTFPEALRHGRLLQGFTTDRPFYDIGTPDDFRAFAARYEEIRHAGRGQAA